MKRQDAMTSAQTMLSRAMLSWLLLGALLAPAGCTQSKKEELLIAPRSLVAPYDAVGGEVLWAVVPLANESGTTEADRSSASDALVAAIEETQGLRCVPLNRTIAAMRALKMNGLRGPGDVRRLADAMGVDGVVIGAVTAYDPYTPAIGISIALYARTGAMNRVSPGVDPHELASRPTEAGAARPALRDAPVATASENLDAKNHQVLMDLKAYAEGRHDQPSALGWRRYTASMDLYTQFAAYHAVDRLLESEWVRLARVEPRGEHDSR